MGPGPDHARIKIGAADPSPVVRRIGVGDENLEAAIVVCEGSRTIVIEVKSSRLKIGGIKAHVELSNRITTGSCSLEFSRTGRRDAGRTRAGHRVEIRRILGAVPGG